MQSCGRGSEKPRGIGPEGITSITRCKLGSRICTVARPMLMIALITPKIAPQHSEWSMTIYGEGPSRSDLQAQVREAGLQSRVRLPGFVDGMDAALQTAGLFVLPSRYEGLSKHIAESACRLSGRCHKLSRPAALQRSR